MANSDIEEVASSRDTTEECFDAAAVRHFRDGDLLHARERLANADQLFGFAAECAIKSALVTLPGCAVGGRLGSAYQRHVDTLWDRAPLQSMQKRYPGLLAVLKALRPFEDWAADQRYGPDDCVPKEVVQRHREAAKRLLGSVGLSGMRSEG